MLTTPPHLPFCARRLAAALPRVASRIAFVAVAGVVVVGIAGAATTTTLRATKSATLKTTILVSAGGYTLYHLTSEKKGSVACTGGCRKTWPPLLVAAGSKPTAGAGVSASKLGTLKRSDGGVQVTYGGFALYRYSGDKKAGETNGQGVGATWYALTPAGTVTKAKPSTSASASTGSTSTGSTSAGSTGAGSTTTPSSGSTGSTGGSSSSGGTATVPAGTDTADGCPPGQGIPQGTYAGDGDEDNIGMPTDGDGCL